MKIVEVVRSERGLNPMGKILRASFDADKVIAVEENTTMNPNRATLTAIHVVDAPGGLRAYIETSMAYNDVLKLIGWRPLTPAQVLAAIQ